MAENIEVLFNSDDENKDISEIEGPFPSYKEAYKNKILHNLKRDFVVNNRRKIDKIIDKINEITPKASVSDYEYVTVAWCVSRPGGWFGIEPIKEVGQFFYFTRSQWARFLSYMNI